MFIVCSLKDHARFNYVIVQQVHELGRLCQAGGELNRCAFWDPGAVVASACIDDFMRQRDARLTQLRLTEAVAARVSLASNCR